MHKVVFFLLLFMVILLHCALFFVKGPKHIKVVDKHAKVQHITLARMVVKQPEVKVSPPREEKKVSTQKKEQIKPKKLPKKVIKPPKHIVKKEKTIKKIKSVHEKRKYIPKQKKQKVYANKESMVTLQDKYINEIRTEIRKKLIYPTTAKRMRIEGVVYVSFTVYKNGQIENIQVRKSSKSILKRSAIKTLEKIVIKAIPSQLGLTKLELSLPISFKLTKG